MNLDPDFLPKKTLKTHFYQIESVILRKIGLNTLFQLFIKKIAKTNLEGWETEGACLMFELIMGVGVVGVIQEGVKGMMNVMF